MFNTLRKIKRTLESEIEKRLLKKRYTALHNDLIAKKHIQEAADWLKRAHDCGDDRGISYGARFGGAFLSSYPETTGYIIPTFLALHDYYEEEDYFRRALEMGDWEIAIQMESGAVMGGRADASPKTPAVFNTGMVLLGWASLLNRTGKSRYLNAGIRAGNWLVEMQLPDGSWREGNSQFARADATVYNVKAAWGLCLFGKTCGEDRFIEAAVKNARYALANQNASGWFANCCLDNPEQPLLHTLAYAIQGVLEIGLLTKRDDLIQSARKSADALRLAMDKDGFLPGRINPDFSGTVKWCCLTGSAQTSIIWSTLYKLSGEEKFRSAATQINNYLMARHDITSTDPEIRGGLAGSWPVWGGYGRLMVLNWATKFLIDALMMSDDQLGLEDRVGCIKCL